MDARDKVELGLCLIGILIVGSIFLTKFPQWKTGAEATAILQSAGYSKIELNGSRFWECDGDIFSLGFTATGPSGQLASGAVCKGILKAGTIRLTAAK